MEIFNYLFGSAIAVVIAAISLSRRRAARARRRLDPAGRAPERGDAQAGEDGENGGGGA